MRFFPFTSFSVRMTEGEWEGDCFTTFAMGIYTIHLKLENYNLQLFYCILILSPLAGESQSEGDISLYLHPIPSTSPATT